jgi:hypothetical protein
VTKLWAAAALAAAAAWCIKLATAGAKPVPAAAAILPFYGVLYFGVTALAGVEESVSTLRRGARLLRRR